MWRRIFKNSKWMSIQMLCSYLAVLAAPLAAIVIFYVQTSSALLDVQYEKSYRMQREAAASFEQQVGEVSNVAGYLVKESEVLRMIKPYSSKLDEFWKKYQFVQNRPDYRLTNKLIRNVYLLSKTGQYMIRMPVVVPVSAPGYQSVTEFGAASYEGLMRELCSSYAYGNIKLIQGNNGTQEMAILYSLQNEKGVAGVVAILLDSEQINEVLGNSNPYEESITCIMGKDGTVIHAIPGMECSLDRDALEGAWQYQLEQGKQSDGYQVITIGRCKYLMCVKTGGVQDWMYVTATPVSVLTEQIRSMRVWLIVLLLLACIVSLLVCTYYWSRRRGLIRQCADFQEKMEEKGTLSAPENHDFWGAVGAAFDHLDTLQETISQQEELVRESVLRNLLYGNYASKKELEPELARAKITLASDAYYVAVWAFDGVSESGMFGDIADFRAYIRHFLQENGMLQGGYFYELNYNTLAVIIESPEIRSLADVKNRFLERNNQLREQVQIECYTGIAGPVADPVQIGAAFEKAKDACEYARYYKMAAPMEKSEIPELTSTLFFTQEQEKRFCETIREGSDEQLCRALEEIRQTIDAQRPSIPVANHYMNFVRSAVIRAVSDYSTEPDMLAQITKISEAESWKELFELTVQAKQLIRAGQSQAADRILEQKKQELVGHIYAHYAESNFNLAVLAKQYGVSESKMYRDFRLYFGRSFAEILENVRIDQARSLLEKGYPVKEVTKQTGYSSDVSFRRAFKRVVGVAPTEFAGNRSDF